jgi:hypothetical protein
MRLLASEDANSSLAKLKLHMGLSLVTKQLTAGNHFLEYSASTPFWYYAHTWQLPYPLIRHNLYNQSPIVP